MKTFGLTKLAGVMALVITSAASAQTNIIHITGAQADRNQLHTAIPHILNPGYVYGYAGSSLLGANQAEFRGTTIVGNYPVDIKTSLLGSTGGIQALVQNLTLNNTWFNGTNLTTGGTANLAGPLESAPADVSISDSFQSSTLFTSPLLVDKVIGATPVVAVKNAGSPAALSNVTSLVAQALLGEGEIPLAQFTGNTNDESIIVAAIGRDENAGQRLIPFAETGFGIFSSPFQYQPLISGQAGPTSGTVTNIIPWPVNTVLGTTYPVGHSGYSTGSALAAALNTPGSSNAFGGFFVSFLAVNDSLSLTNNNGAGSLTYNGVPYSYQAVAEGKYTLWAYTHWFYQSGYSGNPKTVADQIANQIKTTDGAVTGVLLGDLKVGRTIEGGVVSWGPAY